MTEEELKAEARVLTRWEEHKFMVLVAATIGISLFLVVIALQLYNSSGAAQLDLSRPGYKSVRDKVDTVNDIISFPSTGPIDKSVLDRFREQYDAEVKEATAHESFGGDVLSDKALGFEVAQQ